MSTPSGVMSNMLYELLSPLMSDSKERWSFAKRFSTILRKDGANASALFDAMYAYRPSSFPNLQVKVLGEKGAKSSVKRMTSEELEENVTVLLRKSFKDAKVTDVAKLTEITDKLLALFRPKEENKVTAINVIVVGYSDLPDDIAIETGVTQDYTGSRGDEWLRKAYDLISKLSPKERIDWANHNGVFVGDDSDSIDELD